MPDDIITPTNGEGSANANADAGANQDQGDNREGQPDNKPPANQQGTPPPDDSDEEPTVRKTPKDYIIERKNKQIEKLKAKATTPPDSIVPDDEDDEDIADADKTLVKKVVQKEFGHYFSELEEQKLDAEISKFVSDNEIFKPYEAKIRKFASHPTRRQIPLKAIAYEVAGDDLLRKGAEMSKAADAKASAKATPNGGNRGSAQAKKDWGSMTNEEFIKERDKILLNR